MSNSSLIHRAIQVIPGGVNSPVRSFGSVGTSPKIISKAQGAYLWDVEAKQYIDYVGSWGASILGHSHPSVVAAVQEAAKNGLSFGATTAAEILLAERIVEMIPSIEKVRLVSSGTEATMTAIRLARGWTRRKIIVKFDGCYHGHADSLLVKAGSGALTLGQPDSQGIPDELAALTHVLPYNDVQALEDLFEQASEQIAAVIIEPIAGNMNMILPKAEFLNRLSQLCRQAQSVLIFDEVMTGFRVGLQGAQGHYGIQPDLTTFGKVIGGGMPIGAIGGRKAIMDYLAPDGPVYQAGTLSGNPITTAAGLATLNLITEPGFYESLNRHTHSLMRGLQQAAQEAGYPFSFYQQGGMFGFFFSDHLPTHREEVAAISPNLFRHFFVNMLEEGIYFAPSAFEAGFLSTAHDDMTTEETIHAARKVFHKLAKNGLKDAD